MARQEILLCGEQHYREIFARYAAYFAPGRLVFLRGPMGAGKTTFVRALCAELAVDDLVSSPSFALLNLYHAPGFRIAHFDLFRLDAGAQLDDIGALDFVDVRTLTLVEWPENCPGFFPQADLDVAFAFHDESSAPPSGNSLMRSLTMSTHGAPCGCAQSGREGSRRPRGAGSGAGGVFPPAEGAR